MKALEILKNRKNQRNSQKTTDGFVQSEQKAPGLSPANPGFFHRKFKNFQRK